MMRRYRRYGNGTRTTVAKTLSKTMRMKRKQKAMRYDLF